MPGENQKKQKHKKKTKKHPVSVVIVVDQVRNIVDKIEARRVD